MVLRCDGSDGTVFDGPYCSIMIKIFINQHKPLPARQRLIAVLKSFEGLPARQKNLDEWYKVRDQFLHEADVTSDSYLEKLVFQADDSFMSAYSVATRAIIRG